MEVNMIDIEGKVKKQIQLPDEWFGKTKANVHLIHEVVKAYLSNQRKGTHSTLTRTEVSGGGKKPWKQKHTGRARSGSTRSPLWRGGGIIFGPKPRSYRVELPQAKVHSALHQVLSEKAECGDLVVSERPKMENSKTKNVVEWLKKLDLNGTTLLVLDKKDQNLSLASRNLENFKWTEWKNLHPYHILKSKKIILTPEVVESFSSKGSAK